VTTSDSAPCQATGKLRAAIAGDVFVPASTATTRHARRGTCWPTSGPLPSCSPSPRCSLLARGGSGSPRTGPGHGARHMFRHEPAVLLCPPLHTAIRGNSGGRARFTFDEPSDQLASFANAAITAVEAELGQKTEALLSHLGAELPATLVRPRA